MTVCIRCEYLPLRRLVASQTSIYGKSTIFFSLASVRLPFTFIEQCLDCEEVGNRPGHTHKAKLQSRILYTSPCSRDEVHIVS